MSAYVSAGFVFLTVLVSFPGDNLLPGVQETLAELQRAGKRLFYVRKHASLCKATVLPSFTPNIDVLIRLVKGL
jgi:hypothetical protein